MCHLVSNQAKRIECWLENASVKLSEYFPILVQRYAKRHRDYYSSSTLKLSMCGMYIVEVPGGVPAWTAKTGAGAGVGT